MRKPSKHNLFKFAAPAVAAALAVGAYAANNNGELHNNGVPGVDMNVSSQDSGSPANNGVPGVDVDISSQDRGSATNNGVPGVDVNTADRGSAATNGVPGMDMNVGGNADTHMLGAGAGTRAPKADRN
jgi:hypothetical protein